MRNSLQQFILFISLFIISNIVLGQKKQWEEIQKNPTIESYENFLKEHPDSKFSYAVKQQLEEMNWAKALNMNTVESYSEFLKKYPSSSKSSTAKSKIEILSYEKAVAENSLNAYNAYLYKYPYGLKSDSVKFKIEDIIFKQAIDSNTVTMYDTYLTKYWNQKNKITGNEFNYKHLEEIFYLFALLTMKANDCNVFFYYFPNSSYSPNVIKLLKDIILKTNDRVELHKIVMFRQDSLGALAMNQIRKLFPAYETKCSSPEGEILVRLWMKGTPTSQAVIDSYKSMQNNTNAIVAIPVSKGDNVYGEIFILPTPKFNQINGFKVSDLKGDQHNIATTFNSKTNEFDFGIMFLDADIKKGNSPIELTVQGRNGNYSPIRFTIKDLVKN